MKCPLMFLIFLSVQVALIYLGNQAASAVARETARTARVTGNGAEAKQVGQQYADNIGGGILEDYEITVELVGDDEVRVTVTGQAQKISPIGVPRVSQTVQGPLEQFVGGP